MTALLVIAKEPVAGRVKTRLSPPCTAEESARVAAAALADTLDAVGRVPVDRRLLVLEGSAPAAVDDRFEIVPQVAGGLDDRLAAAFDPLDEPAVLVGMDTPQVTAALLARLLDDLRRPGVDAVLGPATDGGFWCIGFERPRAEVFPGVPMSRADTGVVQLERLRACGLGTHLAPTLRDVDRWRDAEAVAAVAPGTQFARTVAAIVRRLLPAATA